MTFKLVYTDDTKQVYEHWVLDTYKHWIADGIIDVSFKVYLDKVTGDAKEGCVCKSVRLTGSDVSNTSNALTVMSAIRAGIHQVNKVDVNFADAVDA